MLFDRIGRIMSKKRILLSIVLILVGIIINIAVAIYQPDSEKNMKFSLSYLSEQGGDIQLFYLTKEQGGIDSFDEKQCATVSYTDIKKTKTLEFDIPSTAKWVRLDLGSQEKKAAIGAVSVTYADESVAVTNDMLSDIEYMHQVDNLKSSEDGITVDVTGDDPYIVWDASAWDLETVVRDAQAAKTIVLKVLTCLVIDLIILFILKYARKVAYLPVEIYQNRKLIGNLAKNDFKTRFAGSYLGIVWAFVQPIVTVLVYWFVFEKGLRANGVDMKSGISVPYVLWLIAGLVPWFFFSEALSSGTNALVEYSYLVKKVVFKISILPIVKVVSALFVHIFFIIFMLVLYSCYGFLPDLYTLQIIYYSFAMFVLVIALTYATCAIVVFFKDLSQIINIILQVGVWMTPIMWNIDTMELSPILLTIFKLNPMYYIVAGYRDALINKVWFWERPEITMYFWLLTIVILGLGAVIFKRLKVHFADVL